MEVKLELIYLLEEICQSLSGDIHMVQSRSSPCLSSQETDEQATACTAVFSLFFQIYRSHITVTLFTVTFQSRLPCVFQQLTLGLSLGIDAVVVLTRDLILTLFQFIWQQTDNLLTTVKCVVNPPFVMLC